MFIQKDLKKMLSEGNKEFEYLFKFAEDKFLNIDIYGAQLKSLWTGYCIHQNLDLDSEKYQSDISALWHAVSEKDTENWRDFGSFQRYMGGDLEKFSPWEGDPEKKKELNYILSFVDGACFEDDICGNQLRSLWTAYCFHHNLTVDTKRYDADILKLWVKIAETEEDTSFWSDFESFDNFMCKYLV